MIQQLMPSDFAAWRDGVQPSDIAGASALPVVLDVREPGELQAASVRPDGFELVTIPMGAIAAQVQDLQERYGADHPIACLCHHGMRSMQVASFLARCGFTNVVNLQGGIDAWSRQVDARVPLY